MSEEFISIELVLALAEEQETEKLLVPKGTTIFDAIKSSKIYAKHTELHTDDFSFGVYGKERAADYLLSPNDRIEIYRDLLQDPKTRRKNIVKE